MIQPGAKSAKAAKGARAEGPSPKRRIKVALVEDQPKVRESWIKLINSFPDFECICSCATGEEAVRTLPHSAPDVVLMDIFLPRMSGIECTVRLKESLPQTQIVILTAMDDQELVFMAQAMLSIRSIKSADGGLQPPTCNNRLQFEALLARFGEDKYLEEFMAHYQKLVNPGIAEVLEKALADAQEQGIVDDEALKTFLQTRMLEYQREQLASVKN